MSDALSFLTRAMMVTALALAPVDGSRADFNTAAAAYREGKFTAALTEFKALAEMGNPQAQYNLAQMYLTGTGPPSSFQMAYGWMTVAAAYGLGDAQKQVKDWAGKATDLDRKRAQTLMEQFGPAAIAKKLLPKPACAFADVATRAEVAEVAEVAEAELPDDGAAVTAMMLALAYVAPDGKARDVRVLESFPRGELQQPILAALMKSRYQPATRDGAPVGGWAMVQYSFHPVGTGVMNREVRNHLRRLRERTGKDDPSVQYLSGVIMKYWVTSRRARLGRHGTHRKSRRGRSSRSAAHARRADAAVTLRRQRGPGALLAAPGSRRRFGDRADLARSRSAR